jgi:hypothetical protein
VTPAAWVADPTLAWIIALEVRLREPVGAEQVAAGLAATGLTSTVHEGGIGRALVERVTAPGSAALRAAVAGTELALGAEHAHCDGLGLLALLGATTGTTATSSAKGVGDRPDRGSPLVSAARRLGEAVFAPPAAVASPSGHEAGDHLAGDVFSRFSVPRRLPVVELTHAAVGAVTAHNRDLSARHARIAVAIGASRVGGAAPVLGDNSALLRLRRAERLSADALRESIRSAVPEPPPPGARGGSRVVARVTTTAMGALSSRLGSTLLVSHLGQVDAPGVEEMAFYPVTGGGSGVSVGAVGLAGTTVVTIRGRGRRYSAAILEDLGRRVRDELSS